MLNRKEEESLGRIEAEADWEEAIALSSFLEQEGRLEDAELVLTMLIRNDFPPAHHNLGLLQEARGEDQAAIASYKKAAELGFEESRLNLGLQLEAMGMYVEAESEYRKIASSDIKARVNLGLLMLQQGEVEEAEDLLRTAATQDGRYYWQLSDVHLAKGDRDKAELDLRLAIEAGEARAARDLAKVVPPDDEVEVRSLFRTAIDAGAIGATVDYIDWLDSRGHEKEALAISADAVVEGNTYAPLVYARLLARDPDQHEKARAMFMLAATNGDDVREDLAALDGSGDVG